MPGVLTWREAMTRALYGPSGFFSCRNGGGPAAHFRTSTHASPLFAEAILTLLSRIDRLLGTPDRLEVVDIGAGQGELLSMLGSLAPPELRERLTLTAVEVAPRPDGLSPAIAWRDQPPTDISGLLIATEWLDNVPIDVAAVDETGTPRLVMVDPANGQERLGAPVEGRDLEWLRSWWPLAEPGARAEIGWPRDEAWAAVVRRLQRGLAVAVDYGHLAGKRPFAGTLTGYRFGRQVRPVPDGSCDITAHVAFDAVAAGVKEAVLVGQRVALRGLGVDGTRPPLALASRDPTGYVRALSRASQAAELTDPHGLGGHYWLLTPVGMKVREVLTPQ